ncbi:hypothetical protein OG394_15955 [Kribbella sp. NBC_01245]|uniref:hypothetical protein n=1 Tax=Kribbella sp. NBC_01245 TaxID=2903578 RepID=UPI002E2812F2|nr:hypothetical protein [Kribbella sp. NBC_01245]
MRVSRPTVAPPCTIANAPTVTRRSTDGAEHVGRQEHCSRVVKQVEPLPPSPPDAPVTEQFTIAAGDPANVVDPGVTGTEFVNTCKAPPTSQDTDGHVTTLTGESGDGAHAISVEGAGVGTWDLDRYFYNSTCQLLGQVATSAADETGIIPSNTKYVVTHLFLGAALPVTLTITDTHKWFRDISASRWHPPRSDGGRRSAPGRRL